MKKILTNKSFYISLIINLLIVTYWLVNSKTFPVHDSTTGARIFELTNAIKDGHFPARWSKNFGFGMGMPLFQFYAPLVFYLATFFNLIGFSILLSIKLVYFTTTIIGFYGAYLLGKKIINHYGGLIAATAFTLAPYHALNIYVRGAIAEYAALSFVPLSLYFAFNILDKEKLKKSYFGLVLSLAVIYLSHNVTVLTFIPFWFLLVSIYALIKNNFKKLLLTLLAQLHSLLISAFFIIPAFIQKSFTNAETLTQGFSKFFLHFLYPIQLITPNWSYGGSILGIDDQMSFYLGIDLILLAIFSTIFIVIKIMKKTSKKNLRKLFLLLLFLSSFLLSIFASNIKSQRLWGLFPLSRFIQFPWRFLGISSLLISILAGFSMLNKSLKKNWFIVLSVIIILNGRFFRPEKLIEPGNLYIPSSNFIQTEMSKDLPDYLPAEVVWQDQEAIMTPVKTTNDDTKVTIFKNTTNSIIAEIAASKKDSIIVNRYYFPNWIVSIDNQPKACQKTKDNLYICQIKPGKSNLIVIWKEKGINAYSNLVSVLALVALILIYLKSLLKIKPSKNLIT